jgi:hypothetical protein
VTSPQTAQGPCAVLLMASIESEGGVQAGESEGDESEEQVEEGGEGVVREERVLRRCNRMC